jgi:hypothetical protein
MISILFLWFFFFSSLAIGRLSREACSDKCSPVFDFHQDSAVGDLVPLCSSALRARKKLQQNKGNNGKTREYILLRKINTEAI